MKKITILFFLAIGLSFSVEKLMAQFVPQGFNYQTVLRNAQGNALSNQTVLLRFSLKSGAPNGPVAYAETQLATTNELGLAHLIIGKGNPVQGSFSAINWGGGAKFLTVEVETAPGVFEVLGTTEMMSVPYAQYALNVAHGGGGGAGDDWGAQVVVTNNSLSGNGTGGNPLGIAQQGAKPGQVLKWDGTKWAPSDDVSSSSTSGGTVTQINTGNGLVGGPITVQGTISLANSGVAPGTWGSATQIPVFTVDATGRITNVFTVTPQPGTVGINGGAGINVQQSGFNFTITNTGDTNPFDDLTNNSQAGGDVSGTFSNLQLLPNVVGTQEIINRSILGEDLNRMDAAPGQVLKWNGTTWQPSIDETGISGIVLSAGLGIAVGGSSPNFSITNTGDTNPNDDLTIHTSADGDVSGVFSNLQIKPGVVGTPELANGAVTASKLDNMGASNGQILRWNGSTWQAANLPSATQISAGVGIAVTGSAPNFTVSNSGDVDAFDDVLKTDQADGDISGVFSNLQIKSGVVGTAELANGAVTGAKIAQMSATNGQMLSWNGTTWLPANVPGDNWGSQVAVVNPTLAGEGIPGNPLRLAQQGAQVGQVLRWNGTTWLPANVPGDDWGSQVARTDATLSGDGTTANPLKIAAQGAAPGQVLKFNGSTWAPANDLTGTGGGAQNNYFAGTGISITGTAPNFTIANTGDLSNTNELQTLNLSGTILSISNGNSVNLAGIGGGGSGNFWVGSGNHISASNTGNVGIGTQQPHWKLTVAGNNEILRLVGGAQLGFGSPNAGTAPDAFLSDEKIAFIVGTTRDTMPLIFAPSRNRTMVVGAKNNVSIGTGVESPFALDIRHGNSGLALQHQTSGMQWEFWVNPINNTLQLYNNLLPAGIPAGTFGINGNYQPSDARLKTGITQLPSVLDKLLKIKPVQYRFLYQKPEEPASMGFLAQEVQTYFPELVMGAGGRNHAPNYLTLNYAGFGVLAVKAIQEQQQQIEKLQQENQNLRSRLEQIEQKLGIKN